MENTVKFRKKPIEVEAWQFDPEAYDAPEWMRGAKFEGKTLLIDTLEGQMTAKPGDWIVRGVKGELYPVRLDIFECTYERAE
jgi:hypothetical protein